MPNLADELLANPDNPRHVTSHGLDTLKRSLRDLGDLGCIIKNVHPGEGEGGGMLVSGHQRVTVLQNDPHAEIVITKHYDAPTRTGTVAEGYVLSCGESYAYREVHWDKTRAKLAALAANNHASVWDEHLLVTWLQDLQAAEVDLDLTLFDEDVWQTLLPEHFDEVMPDAPEDAAQRPDAKPTPRPSADAPKPEPALEPLTLKAPGTPIKQIQLIYTERDHAEFVRMVGVIQAKYGHQEVSEAVMEAVQQASEG